MQNLEIPISPMKRALTAKCNHVHEEVHSDASTSADSVDVKKNSKFDRTKEYKKK
jgi:hypothetical protein